MNFEDPETGNIFKEPTAFSEMYKERKILMYYKKYRWEVKILNRKKTEKEIF